MKRLSISFKDQLGCSQTIEEISLHLDKLEKHFLEFAPWPSYPYKPETAFAIAYSNDCIFLKYFVKEKSIKAAAGDINGAVWNDACVEFFISFDDKGYYNLEFNCIGTALGGFGKGKEDRNGIAENFLREIKYVACITNKPDNIHWELTLIIPASVFVYHNITLLKGAECKANFYKCGDGLHEPHFIAWSAIESPEPDFHLPQFFGDIVFA
jgi:hypothetical protein